MNTPLAAALAGALLTCAAPALAQWAPPGAPAAPYPQQPPGAQAPPPTQPAQPGFGGMQAGGLTPPPPVAPAPASGEPSTAAQLDEAKAKDSGRGLEWVYLDVHGGFEQVGLKTFNVDKDSLSAGFFDTSASGGVIGAGLGLRLLFFTLGARGRLGLFDAWQLMSVGGELGLHIPLGNFEPHVDLGGGYAAVGNVTKNLGDTAVSVRGFYGRVGGGLDYYVTPVFSVGGAVSWEVLGLTRPGLSLSEVAKLKSGLGATDPKQAQADVLAADGTSYGSALAITGVLGLHF